MKYYIFDLDGTLLDSMAIWENIDVLFLKRYGINPTTDLRNRIKIMSIRESAELFRETFKLAPKVEAIMSEIAELCRVEYSYHIQLKPYVLPFLVKLSQLGTRMCIATTSSRFNAQAALERLGILKYFDFILGSEDVSAGKEEPDIFLECCAWFGVLPDEVTVFEDALFAVRTAKKAGFRVVGVYDESTRKDSDEIRRTCDRYIHHFGELEDSEL